MIAPFDHLEIPDFLKAEPGVPRPAMPEDHPVRVAAAANRAANPPSLDQNALRALWKEQDQQKARERIAAFKASRDGQRWDKKLCRWIEVETGKLVPTKMAKERTMPATISAAGERTFSKRADAVRAASTIIGRPAIEGTDVIVEPKGERFVMVLKSGLNGITSKIAPGKTEIERVAERMQEAAKKPAWPTKADGSNKKVGEMTPVERKGVFKAAADKVKAELESPAIAKVLKAKAPQKPAKAPKAKPAPKKPAKAAKPASKPAPAGKAASDGKSKVAVIAGLLRQKGGTTRAAILEATGWPSVSVPQQAKAAGIELKSEKKPGSPTRYWAG